MLKPRIPDEELAAFVGGGPISQHMRTLDPSRADELVRVYREHNEPLHDGLQAFDGVDEHLATLSPEGRKLGVVTAKRRKTVDLAFAVLPIERYFDVVVTTESTAHDKPHPEPVLLALSELGSHPDKAAFVGDSPYDVGAGKAAGVFSIGVSWGGMHPEERLRAAGADLIVHSPRELLDVL